jgi:hypothetical protein
MQDVTPGLPMTKGLPELLHKLNFETT